MRNTNLMLIEAVADTDSFNIAPIITQLKRNMGACRMANFGQNDINRALLNFMFLCEHDTPNVDDITFYDWVNMYRELLADAKFNDNLCNLMALQENYTCSNLFDRLYRLAMEEFNNADKRKIHTLGFIKAQFNLILIEYTAIAEVIKPQVLSPKALQFVGGVIQSLEAINFNLTSKMHEEINKARNIEDTVDNKEHTPSKEALEVIRVLKECVAECESWHVEDDALNEAVVNDAVMKVKSLNKSRKQKVEGFDHKCNLVYSKWREKKRDRKHKEMVGDALQINRELKRVLATSAVFMVNPAIAAIGFIGSVGIDKATSVQDRTIIVRELNNELEIIEEKISQAERAGDDKAKIKLIRIRQKLQEEHKRVTRFQYDANRLHK